MTSVGGSKNNSSRVFRLPVFGAGCLAALLLVMAGAAHAADCTSSLATLVLVKGNVELVRQGTTQLVVADANSNLCAGDTVVVHARSQAALLLSNATVVRLDQGTTVTLSTSAGERAALLNVVSGAAYVISRTPRPFRVKTPFINANVEGTEFLVEVRRGAVRADDRDCPDDTAPDVAPTDRVTVFEGKVRVSEADAQDGPLVLGAGETAVATSARGPVRDLVLRTKDSVAWTLYVPAVLQRQAAPDTITACATHLLSLGRLDDARKKLDGLLAAGPGQSVASRGVAHALLATIALTENDTAAARQQSALSLSVDPGSAPGWAAASYVQQASFEIEKALASARKADTLAPSAARQARIAELLLALGDIDHAFDTAAAAARLEPGLAKAQTVVGFVHLLRIETARAGSAFAAAIAIDPADPLPRLGHGLTLIRRGQLEEGREQIEIAALLDTENALMRSYLGKSYYEEKRNRLAADQFALAKSLDPNDPTPYLYDAIRKQSANQPVEALRDLLRSIELNDNRAVYRSRLLLDEDRATRQVNLASIYSELGSDREAIALSSQSVNEDPSNYSAHRFLSEAYATRDRHDIARTSELLQAQLLQPVSLNPVAAELPFPDLGLPSSSAQAATFSDEYSSVFERNRVQAFVGGIAGNLGTNGTRVLLSGLQGPLSGSIGLFNYSTDGFRPNSDLSHHIWNTFVQFAASPSLSLQAEYRKRSTEQGDVAMTFDPDYFAPRDRVSVDQRTSRLGATFRPTTESTWIASAIRSRETFDYHVFLDQVADTRSVFEDAGTSYEAQYQGRFGDSNLVVGAGRSRIASRTNLHNDFTPLLGVPCAPEVEPCDSAAEATIKQWNGYAYLHLKPASTLSATVGLSRDSYEDGLASIHKWNPKLGLRFLPSRDVTLRAAAFGSMKRSLLTQQTIEPTQVVGFNQLYDDVVGSTSRFYVAALDVVASPSTALGVEVGRQNARVATGTVDLTTLAPVQTLHTEWLRVDASYRPSSQWIASLGARTERFTWDATVPTDSPTYLLTTKVPLALRTFNADGFFAEVVTTGVWQHVKRLDTSAAPVGKEAFVVVDTSIGYKLPGRRGVVSLDVKNLFGSRFSYQDDDFRSTETRVSPYLPVRRIWLKASLAF